MFSLQKWSSIFFVITFSIPGIYSRIPDEPSINMVTAASTPTSTTIMLDAKVESGVCFKPESDICDNALIITEKKFPPKCDCFLHPRIAKSLICCNITDIEKVLSCTPINNSTEIVNLHIRNATLDEIDLSKNFWKLLDSMIITNGNIKKITKEFTRFSKIKCLNVSNNNLTEINPRAFKDLNHLQVLDMSHNNLSTMPKINNQNNLKVDIQGNNAMLCKSVIDSIERGGFDFIETNSSYCLINQTFSWFNSTEAVPLNQLIMIKQLQNDCPQIPGFGNCTCSPEQMNFYSPKNQDIHPHLIFQAKVDCSGLGLTELPKTLPENTLSLNVSNNKIKSLSGITDPTYKTLVRFYAEDNLIDSMFELEGTDFITNFQILNLRQNKLQSIPIYVLSNALDKTATGIQVHLGGNHLTCDCNAAKVLRHWLLERQNHIADYDQILCENTVQKVIEISETKLCQSQHDWTDYIYYLIAAEILLLLALVLKVSYDYWIFKTAGYLPWPANKMPKLPCDWLCES